MVSPLPRAKRAKNPRAVPDGGAPAPVNHHVPEPPTPANPKAGGFTNNPFAKIEAE